jgi:ribosomal protein S18 acetylase RimI-like enzyme
MVELERIFALWELIDERTAERLEPTPYGQVVVNERLRKVHDLNFLRAEHPGSATVAELAAEAERIQGAAGVDHRRVDFRDQAEDRAPEFLSLGWERQRFLLMAHRRAADPSGEIEVREVDEEALRPLWAEAIRREPHGKDEDLVEQILEHRRLVTEAVPTRLFAVAAGSRLVAHAELYCWEGTGQVENVVTLEEFRNRGFARALVSHAVAQSRAAGNDFTFLVSDADDWPQQLYGKLGFEAVGRYARFLKPG